MKIDNNNSQHFTAVRIVDATPVEVLSFKKSFPEFYKRNKVFRHGGNFTEELKRPLYIVTGWDIVKLKLMHIRNMLKFDSAAKKQEFLLFLQKNNVKQITFDDFLEEVISKKI